MRAHVHPCVRSCVVCVCVSVNLTCESSVMEFDATVEVADEWLTVEALDTAAVAVHSQHTHAHTHKCARTQTYARMKHMDILFAVNAHASGNCMVSQ